MGAVFLPRQSSPLNLQLPTNFLARLHDSSSSTATRNIYSLKPGLLLNRESWLHCRGVAVTVVG